MLKNKSEIENEDLCQWNYIAFYSTSSIRKHIENILSQHNNNTDRFTIEMQFDSIEAIKSAVQSELEAVFVSYICYNKTSSIRFIILCQNSRYSVK